MVNNNSIWVKRMRVKVLRTIKKWRAKSKKWSKTKDRLYHDGIFARACPNPFSWSYPGSITIRRFADLVSPYLKGLAVVIDVGCGCGELTCELARRFPSLRFLGIDHSQTGIQQARTYARMLQLKNASFEVADIDVWEPPHPVDLIMLFNAFHHLPDPDRFIRRMERWTSRFVLIEPHGDWKGSHVKRLDFDWIVLEFEKVRSRIAWLLNETLPVSHPEQPSKVRAFIEDGGDAVEYRYTLDEFRHFFKHYSLEVRGTVAGIERYPPLPFAETRTREFFGRWLYELYKDIDEVLYEQKADLLAKHWVIYAAKGRSIEHKMHWPPPKWASAVEKPVIGPYDIEYEAWQCPRRWRPGERAMVSLRIRNRGWMPWSSRRASNPIYVSYHWLDHRGRVVIYDGIRTRLPTDIAPGEACEVRMWIEAPGHRGRHDLVIDLVHEGVTWFSEATGKSLCLPCRIR